MKKKLDFLYISNSDGSPRWIWPSTIRKPLFLNFYAKSTLKQKLYAFSIKCVFLCRIQKVIFKTYSGRIESVLYPDQTSTYFMGTPGPNRKIISYSNETKSFTKMAIGDSAGLLIENEYLKLSKLSEYIHLFPFDIPHVIDFSNRHLTVTSLQNQKGTQDFTKAHAKSLNTLRTLNQQVEPVEKWMERNDIQTRIEALQHAIKIDPQICVLLNQLLHSISLDASIQTSWSHGDFTPWNCFFNKEQRLQIIDWELASEHQLTGYDFFHFFFQKGILLEKKTWKEIYEDIKLAYSSYKELIFGQEDIDLDLYLRLYLIQHISYYAALYERQRKWFDQIQWQLKTWKNALTWAIGHDDQRTRLIDVFFQSIHNQQYAVLKLGNSNPAEIKNGQDLDILIQQKDLQFYVNVLQDFPFTKKVKVHTKSFMSTIRVQLRDGDLLHIDLIWKFKRKHLVFLDVKNMLNASILNPYHVKVVNDADNAAYVSHFYALNNASIPQKYQDLILRNTSQLYKEGSTQTNENKGLRRLFNFIIYGIDVSKDLLFNQGFIVTFSGVDGAGKSTLINEVKGNLEEKFRRPVKVLRHRPSIVPIISSIKYGKEKAELKTVERLPRQGKNTNFASSLLRFLYYYFDYFVGQFYVQLKYVMQGYIVLYDRYYYDFINDAKRSNIELHPRIPKFGLRFLLIPRYNYFLYASPEVILKRKKELTSDTILSLTDRYISLFSTLQSTSTRKFMSIENIQINRTSQLIISDINI